MTVSTPLVEPAFLSIPPHRETLGPEVADICELAGYVPDDNQRMALDAIFAMDGHNKVAALEAAVVACRQNIKTGLFKMCVLGWLFVTDQQLITWSAHEFDTTKEAHRELAELIEGCTPLRRRLATDHVHGIHRGSGDMSIELATGQRVKFKARTNTGGRGLSGDKMVMDEAFALQPSHMGSLFPTLSARDDPQIVYGSSAGHTESAVLRGLRDRGRPGDDPSLIYIEWTDDLPGECVSPVCDHALRSVGCRLDDQARWFRANPTLGDRITVDYVAAERRALPPGEFARERLGWWEDDPLEGGVFPPNVWDRLYDPLSAITGPVTFAVEVAKDRSSATIAAVGDGPAGLHLEIVDYHKDTAWIKPRLVELSRRHHSKRVVVRPQSPAGALIDEFEGAGLTVVKPTTQEYAQACGGLLDLVKAGEVRHLAQPPLNISISSAQTKPSADAWVWDQKNPHTDISPLKATTLAVWGSKQKTRPGRFMAF